MAISASAITPENTLEEFRVQFNKLVTDVDGVASGNTFTQSLIFEGATADEYETTLIATDPTADRTITMPNATGTLLVFDPTGTEDGNSDSPPTVTSTSSVSHVLVNHSGKLKKITLAHAGIGAVAADDISTGDGAVTIATSSGNITIDAQAGDADIIFKGTDSSADITALTLDMSDAGKAIFNGAVTSGAVITSGAGLLIADAGTIGSASDTDAMAISSGGVVSFSATTEASATGTAAVTVAGGLGVAKDIWVGDDLTLDSDAAVISFGDDQDVTLTHVADTGILLNSTMVIQFNDASQNIGAPTNAILDINATDEIELNATLVDVNGTLDVSGTYTGGGLMTTGGNIVIPDAGNIGSASDTDAIAISSGGVVNFTQAPTVASAAIKTAGLETIWVPASAMYPCTSNGCAALTQVETTANQPEMKVLDFDKDSDEFAQFTVAFPKSWNAGTITYRAFWFGLAATTGVAWALQGRSVADNAESVGAFGTAVVVQDDSQGDATEVLISATSGAVTIAGVADDTLTFFQIYRDVSDGNDDMAGDARLAGIQIFYTTSAATDA